MKIKGFVILALLLLTSLTVLSEGTREIIPGTNVTRLVLRSAPTYTNFARYGCLPHERLNFTICGANERVHLGFSKGENSTVRFRVRRWSDDATVLTERDVPVTGQEGHIPSLARANAGPAEIVGAATGYDAITITGLTAGDYYVEFSTTDVDFEFQYFDITVANAANQAIRGRVWSREWLLTTRGFNNPFDGTMYVYSDDGIVTSIDFNGIRPYVFNISANPTGVKTTGNFNEDRQSVVGNQTYPQYKIFINPPDENCFPSGEFGQITDLITVTGCGLNKCINIPVDQQGRVLILLDLNGQPGYQPNSADIQLDTVVQPGVNCIPWNTRNNLGQLVPEGTNINLQIDYLNGITHLPLFDVESHPNGYSVGLVRPLSPQVPVKPFLFWDDINILSQGGVQGTRELLGCQLVSCHTWLYTNNFNNNQPDYGNLTTINTWWYANIVNRTTNYVVNNAVVDADTRIIGRGIDGGNDTTICTNSGAYQLAGDVAQAPSATWSSSGSGTFSNVNDLFGTYTPSQADYNAGFVTLSLTSDPYDDCPQDVDFMRLNLDPGPTLTIGAGANLCETNSNAPLQGSFSNADGVLWSGGNGVYIPNNQTTNGTYNPTQTEIDSGFVKLYFSTNNITNVCPNIVDSVIFTFQEAPEVNLGVSPQAICASAPFVQLSGTVENAGGGRWIGGNGQFLPSRDSLNARYVATNAEKTSGQVTLTLSSRLETNGCQPVTEDLTISFIASSSVAVSTPLIQACANTDTIPLSSTVTGNARILWSGGNGTFSPSDTVANPEYIVHPNDTSAGSITLYITTDGSDGCSIVRDSLRIQFSSPPTVQVDATNKTVCANNPNVDLSGAFSNASGIRWIGRGGTFSPSNDTLNAVYIPSQAEINGIATFVTLTTVGNGFCEPAEAVVNIVISPSPVAQAGGPYTVCKNNPSVQLNGSSQIGLLNYWSSSEGTFSDSLSRTAIFTATQNQVDLGLPVTLTFTSTLDPFCLPVSSNAILTFTPAPTVDAGPTQAVCANNPQVQLNGSFTGASGVTWSGGTGTASNINAPGATYTPSQAEINAGSAKLYLTTTSGLGSCSPVVDSVSITINPAPVVEAGPLQTVCENNALITLNGSVQNASGGIWSGGQNNVTPNATRLTNAHYSPTNGEKSNGSVTLTLTSTGNGNCLPVSDDVTIIIDPRPRLTNFGNRQVCADAPSVSYSPNLTVASGGIWSGGEGTYSPSNTSLELTYTPSLSEINSGFVNLRFTTTGNDLCNAEEFNRTITIARAPIVSAGSNQILCGDINSAQLNGTVTNATGGLWTTMGSGSFINATNLNTRYQPSNQDKTNGSVRLVLTTTGNGLCNAVSDTMRITFSEVPEAEAGNNRTLCSNELPITLNASGSVGSWLGGSGVFSPDRNTLNATYTPSQAEIDNGTLVLTYQTAVNGVCPQVSDNVTFRFRAGPSVEAGPSIDLCGNVNTINLSAQIQNAGNGFWSTSGTGAFSPSSGNSSTTYIPSASDTSLTDTTQIVFFVGTVGNGGCPPAQDSLVVRFIPAPIVIAGPDQTRCADGNDLVLNGSSLNTNSVQWTGGNGGTFSSANAVITNYTPTATDLSESSISFVLRSPTLGVCPANADTMVVTLIQSPTAEAGENTTICADSTFLGILASITGATAGVWSTNGTGTFSPTATDTLTRYYPSLADTSMGEVILYFTTSGSGICADITDSLILTISDAPRIIAGNDTTICGDTDPIQLQGFSNGVASGVIWSTSGTGTFSDPTDLNATYTLSQGDIANSMVSLTLQSTGSGDCNDVSSSFNIMISPSPRIEAGLNQRVCITSPSVMVSANVQIAGGVRWSSLTNGTFADSLTLTTNYFFSSQDTANGIASLIATTTGNGDCKTYSDTVFIDFQDLPIVNAGNDLEVCGDAASVPLNGTVFGASGANWSSSSTGIFTPNFASLSSNYRITSSDTANGSVSIFLTSTGSGVCPDVVDTLIVSITDVPRVFAGNDTSVCANVASIPLNGSIEIATGGQWLSSGTGVFSPNDTTLNAVYIPSSSDTASGNVRITLASTGNGTCSRVIDDYTITFIKAPRANAGPNTTVCAENDGIVLNSTITSYRSLVWRTSGSGVFGPDTTRARPTYYPSSADTANGSVTLSVFVNGNATCAPITSSTTVNFVPVHELSVNSDYVICQDTRLLPLTASVKHTNGGRWSSPSSGGFTPSAFDLSTSFAPTNTSSDSIIKLIFTTEDGGICPPVSDSVLVFVTPKPIVDAGPSLTFCADIEFFTISGSVQNATGGKWSTSGSGQFLPNENNVVVQYALSANDAFEDSIVFSLSATDTNNCETATSEMVVNLTPFPTISAGSDINVCPGVASIPLSGNVTVATGGLWETLDGIGNFTDANQLNTEYIPDPTESVEGNSITLTLNTVGNGDCRSYYQDVLVTFTNTAFINAIPNDTTVCNTDFPIQLGAQGAQGEWSTLGSGAFFPNNRTQNAVYIPSSADSTAGTVKLYLTSINNGACPALLDSLTLSFIDGPIVDAGSDLIVCTNDNQVTLQGSRVNTNSVTWSSSGRGQFNDLTSLTPTYTLTPQDKSLGFVNFTITSLDNGLCSQPNDRMKVTILLGPTVNPGNGFTICSNETQIQLNGAFTNASGATWTGGSNSFLASNTTMNARYQVQAADTTSGSVTLTLTTQGHPNCNPASANVTFSFRKEASAEAGDNQIICANVESIDLRGIGRNAQNRRWTAPNGTGQFSPSNQSDSTRYFLSATDTTLSSLTFYYLVTPSNICPQVRDSIVLTINPSPIVNAGPNINECETVPTINLGGSIQHTNSLVWISSGNGTFTPDSITLNAQYLPDSLDLVKGAINLELRSTDPNCNPVSDFATINFVRFPEAIVNAGVDITVCADVQQIPLQGTIRSAAGGKWSSSGSGSFTPNDSVLDAIYVPSSQDTTTGTIAIRLTAYGNAICGEVTDSINVTFTTTPKADLGGNIVVCEDTAFVPLRAQLEVANGVIWNTSGSGIFAPSRFDTLTRYIPSVEDKIARRIVLSVTTTGNGTCQAITESISLQLTPTPSIDAGISQLVCETNEDIAIKGSLNIATTGVWSTSGNGNFDDINATNTIYHPGTVDISNGLSIITFTTVDHGQCKPVSDQFILEFEMAPLVFAGVDRTICEDFISINLNGTVENESSIFWSTLGSGFFANLDGESSTYTLSDGDRKSSAINLLLTAAGKSNCAPVTDTITVFVARSPEVEAEAGNLCALTEGASIFGTIEHALGGIWSTDGTGSFSPSTVSLNGSYFPSFFDAQLGGADLTLTSTGNGLCKPVSAQAFVEILPVPTANAGQDQTVCRGSSVTLTARTEPNIRYEWQTTSGNIISTTPTALITADSDTSFVLFAIRQDGCSARDVVSINVFDLPTIEIDTHFCFNDTLLVTANVLNMPMVPGNFQWFREGVIIQDARSTSYIIPSPGNYSIAFSFAGCVTDTGTYVSPLPVLFSQNEIGCKFDSTLIQTTALTNVSYQWTQNNVVVSNTNPTYVTTPLDSAIFTVGATNALGCTSFDSLKVYGVDKPIFSLVDTLGCDDAIITLNAEPENSADLINHTLLYSWSRNGISTNDTTALLNAIQTGIYVAEVHIGQCVGIDTADVSITDSPILTLPPTLGICVFKNETTTVDAGEGFSYLWSNGDTTRITTIADTGLFSVIVTNEFMCSSIDTVVVVEICPPEIFVPKAFVPGFSNPDELFNIFGHHFREFKMTIYNRWGEVIYYTEDPKQPWDGYYLGDLMPVGVYPWVIEYSDLYGVAQKPLEGSVTIVR